jgi:hypothetical protein
MKIIVGHGAYKGANLLRVHHTTHGAVMDLIRRSVDRTVARKKVTEATTYPYPHTTMRTANGAEVIEVRILED